MLSNRRKIALVRPRFDDFSIETEILKSTPFDLLVVNENDDLNSVVADPSVVGLITTDTKIDKSLIDRISSSCRIVTRLGVGFREIDVESCRKRNIEVCYVPDYGTNEVADHAVALLFAAHRRLNIFQRSIVEKQIWNHQTAGNDLQSLSTKTLGVIGLGRIGSAFVRKMEPFVKNILTFDPINENRNSSIEEIFEKCQIISLHIPENEENFHFLSRDSFQRMKQRPIIINVSRGSLIDTRALIEALRQDQISFAALDVLENEPHIDPDLIQLDRVQLTPHVAWFTRESEVSLRTKALNDILRVLHGIEPLYPVPQ